jgi:hypothetical protein
VEKFIDKDVVRKKQACAYTNVCYLAEAMNCFGYKRDCPLYQKSNGRFLTQDKFHAAVDQLIDKTKARHLGLL